MIKGTAKAISDYEIEEEYRLSLQQSRVKGASYVDPTARIERLVKLEMLGKMIKESKKVVTPPSYYPRDVSLVYCCSSSGLVWNLVT
jgi:hypothetical protein